jgi:hypothetical protein
MISLFSLGKSEIERVLAKHQSALQFCRPESESINFKFYLENLKFNRVLSGRKISLRKRYNDFTFFSWKK